MVQEIWRELLQTLDPEQLSGLREAGLNPSSLCQGLARLDGEPCPQLDCDDDDFDINPAALEACNHVDDNCTSPGTTSASSRDGSTTSRRLCPRSSRQPGSCPAVR